MFRSLALESDQRLQASGSTPTLHFAVVRPRFLQRSSMEWLAGRGSRAARLAPASSPTDEISLRGRWSMSSRPLLSVSELCQWILDRKLGPALSMLLEAERQLQIRGDVRPFGVSLRGLRG